MDTEPESPIHQLLAVGEINPLEALDIDVRDQSELERDIGREAHRMVVEKAAKNETKRLEKALASIAKLDTQIDATQKRLDKSTGPTARRLEVEVKRLKISKTGVETDVSDIKKRIKQHEEVQEEPVSAPTAGRLPNESRREYLLRIGHITPFDKVSDFEYDDPAAPLHNVLLAAEDEQLELKELEEAKGQASQRILARPALDFDLGNSANKRQKIEKRSSGSEHPEAEAFGSSDVDSSDNYVASEEEDDFAPDPEPEINGKRKMGKGKADVVDLSSMDDGRESIYQARLKEWTAKRREARDAYRPDYVDDVNIDEWVKPHPNFDDMDLQNGVSVPGDIAQLLFPWQRTGVQWLWELHQKDVGGIIGDEMGLGKTVQAIAYLAALHHSNKFDKPTLVVCPATVMFQWVKHFHEWWPPFRVSILHSTGSGMMNLTKENQREDRLYRSAAQSRSGASQRAAERIADRVCDDGHILITTYAGLQTHADMLTDIDWGSVFLDEGHKIRNPNANITMICKELRTPHRMILSGTPIQNSLIDLWSLFDFVAPMQLGNLESFRTLFDIPIRLGGYSVASNLEVQIATKCAETLKAAIEPLLLTRYKTDVAKDLPNKSEQIVFCKLTGIQRKAYKRCLASLDMQNMTKENPNYLQGMDLLRKICNHPDLADFASRHGEPDYGKMESSVKMQVLQGLLQAWKKEEHKTLVFCQTRQMLDILDKFLHQMNDITHLQMSGQTPIKRRPGLVEKFNDSPDIDVFLMTTRVGGIGINLTSADRVILFDPDWNPANDIQARDRAWRLGQKRDVHVYRLLLKGTIEDKIYHRQIWKQFLGHKITKDPQYQQDFNLKDMHNVFTLDDDVNDQPSRNHAVPAGKSFKTQVKPAKNSDGEISGVVQFETIAEMTKSDDEKSAANTEEDRLLKGIFAGSGTRDTNHLTERSAARIAEHSAVHLRLAKAEAKKVPIGLPTWTGKYGAGGRSTSEPELVGALPRRMPKGFKDFKEMIIRFLRSHKGPVRSDLVSQSMKPYTLDEARMAHFKKALAEVADIGQDMRRNRTYTLKPKYVTTKKVVLKAKVAKEKDFSKKQDPVAENIAGKEMEKSAFSRRD